MHPGWQRIYCCLFKKNSLTKQKKYDLNSSSFWAGSVRSHVCSSPAYLAQGPTASHGIGLPLLCLDRQVSLGPFLQPFPKGHPLLTPYLILGIKLRICRPWPASYWFRLFQSRATDQNLMSWSQLTTCCSRRNTSFDANRYPIIFTV